MDGLLEPVGVREDDEAAGCVGRADVVGEIASEVGGADLDVGLSVAVTLAEVLRGEGGESERGEGKGGAGRRNCQQRRR